jgi:hypothetical protein
MPRFSGIVAAGLIASTILSANSAYGRGHMHGFSPRGGGFGGASFVMGAAASQMAQRRAWEAREAAAEAARRARNNKERMVYADKARKEGKPRLAAMLYLRVALAKPKSPYNATAKKALIAMADEGRAEMKKADQLLSSGEVVEAFQKFDYLDWAYENVPKFHDEIAGHISKLRKDPKYLAVLNEADAEALLKAAKKHEADQEMCCAFLVYEEAAKLTPARSAILAEGRLKELKADAKVVKEADECRAIRESVHIYHTAELLEKSAPDRAAELFKKILNTSPDDSEVYKCAREELAKIERK